MLWYPGSEKRYAAYQKAFPSALEVGLEDANPDAMPLLISEHLAPEQAELSSEYFVPILQHVEVEAANGEEFMAAATKLANERVHGDLVVSVYAPGKVYDEMPAAVEKCLEELRFGSVVLNGTPLVGFTVDCGSWGGYAGNGPEDIQSGNAFVSNAAFVDHPLKQVIRDRDLGFPGKSTEWLLNFVANPSYYTLALFVGRFAAYHALGV